ncbi:hypothetical protein [Cupriavidus sp. CP313]
MTPTEFRRHKAKRTRGRVVRTLADLIAALPPGPATVPRADIPDDFAPALAIPSMCDYSQTLDATYALLTKLRDAQAQGDRVRLASLAEAVDWAVVADEFETVAGRYRGELRERATHIMTALLALPLAYEAAVELRIEWETLAAALSESPSLQARAEPDLHDAWQTVRRRDATLPAACPWPSVEALREALDAAIGAKEHEK